VHGTAQTLVALARSSVDERRGAVLSPGTPVRIKPEWVHAYRKPETNVSGIVTVLSPSGTIIRVQMGELGHSYVLAAHVEPLPIGNGGPEAPVLSEH
jgi:hypothetical protein